MKRDSETECFMPFFLNDFRNVIKRPKSRTTMNSISSNSFNLIYQRFTQSGCKDIGIRKFECVAKTQFLYDFLSQIVSFM